LALIPLAPAIASASLGDPSRAVLFMLAFLAAPLSLMNRICSQILRNQYRSKAFTLLNVLSTGLVIALSVLATVGLGLGVAGVLLGTFLAEVISLPIRLWVVRRALGRRASVGTLRNLLTYGLPLVPTSLAYWVFLTSDRLILGMVSTLDQLGFYSVASTIVATITMFSSAFGQAWTPHAVEMFETDRANAARQIGQVATYLLAGFGLLAVAVTVFRVELVSLLADPSYLPATVAIAPLAIAIVALASTHVTAIGISLAKRTSYLAACAATAAALNVVLNLLLDGSFGLLGAAWATAATYTTLTLMYLLASQRLWPVQYEVRRASAVLAVAGLFLAGASFLDFGGALLGVFLKGAYCAAFIPAIFVSGGFDVREIAYVREQLRRAVA
jgi:O-antigen/teichoic acid export membrane protein